MQLADYQAEAFKHDLLLWFTADSLKIIKMSSDGHPVAFVSIFCNPSWQLTIADVSVESDHFVLEIHEHDSDQTETEGREPPDGKMQFEEKECRPAR